MSVHAKVFLVRENGLKFSTAWINEDTEKAKKELGLTEILETVDIAFDGKYDRYKVGKHDVFVKRSEA